MQVVIIVLSPIVLIGTLVVLILVRRDELHKVRLKELDHSQKFLQWVQLQHSKVGPPDQPIEIVKPKRQRSRLYKWME